MTIDITAVAANPHDISGRFKLKLHDIEYYLVIGTLADVSVQVAIYAHTIEDTHSFFRQRGPTRIDEEIIVFISVGRASFLAREVVIVTPDYAELEKKYLSLKHKYDHVLRSLKFLKTLVIDDIEDEQEDIRDPRDNYLNYELDEEGE